MRKNWIVVFGLILIGSVFLSLTLPIKAQAPSYSVISSVTSLEGQNIISPNTDIKLIAVGIDGFIYAAVYRERGEYYLVRSEDLGRTWEEASARGLPQKEAFVSLETSPDHSEIVAVATTTTAYLSYDGGESFGCLGGPQGLTERKEEITSLAISAGNPPQILVGIWNPKPGEFPQEGVYLWGHSWEGQGLKQGRWGYQAEVTSVAFFPALSTILVGATGDPDGPESLPEGTYLNMAYPNGEATIWNKSPGFVDWPVEITGSLEEEILSSKIVEFEEGRWTRIYLLVNSRDKSWDEVYKVDVWGERASRVQEMRIPRTPEILSLDSLDYLSGTLAVGLTTEEGAQVYYLDTAGQRFPSLNWSTPGIRETETWSCQVALSPNFSEEGIIFLATSGEESSFSWGKEGEWTKDTLNFSKGDKTLFQIPVSLMDISGRINQLVPSPNFLEDRSFFINYGDKTILKVILGEDYQIDQVERVLFAPERFNPTRIEIEPSPNYANDQTLFVFERGTGRFWIVKSEGLEDEGLTWIEEKETEVEIVDAKVVNNRVIYIAREDSMIYRSNDTGESWRQRISSGISFLQKIEWGPAGGILALGGSESDVSDTISLVRENHYEILPFLPTSVSYPDGLSVVYSPTDRAVYCGAGSQLWRLELGQEGWEEIAGVGEGIDLLLISPQALYLFSESQVYFSPLSQDSQWEVLEEVGGDWLGGELLELDEERNILFFWNSSEIGILTHQIEEEPEEEIVPEPVEPELTETPETPWVRIGIGIAGAAFVLIFGAILVLRARSR